MKNYPKARRMKWPLIVAILAGAVGVGGYFNQPSGNPARFETAAVTRGELTQVVTASGQLNPVIKVEVGSQISGIIENLLADFNSNVKAGQLIAEIDPGTYEANFIQAEGNLANAKAGLELAQVSERRAKTLRTDQLNSQAEYDNALAGLHQAEATVRISEGALKKAQVDLARCKIHSPIDGIVISRDVNVGQTVAASLSAPKLFVIANDLSKMQIDAGVSEADIGAIEVGQDVEFTVDALPGQPFHGKVLQVRNAPLAEQNVVTYGTIIEVGNPNLKLKPGMTANVSVIVAHRENVLKVSNAALRFRPPKNIEIVKADKAGKDATDPSVKSDKKAVSGEKAEVEKKADLEKKSDSAKPKKDKKDKRKSDRAVYVLRDGALQPVKLKLGISDGRETELIEGLKEGDAVVVELAETKETPTLASRMLAMFKKKKE